MWGVFDFVCLDFFVAFFIPAGAPSLRSTSGASLAVSDSAENSNFRNRNAEDCHLFSCVMTIFTRVNLNILAIVASPLLFLSCVSAFALL